MPELTTITNALADFAFRLLMIGLPIIAAAVARYIHAQSEIVLARLKQENAYLVEVGTKIAVQMAQQLYDSGAIEDRKDEAVAFLTDWLKTRGINLPVAEIEQTIEAAVYNEINPKTEATVQVNAGEVNVDRE